MPPRLAARAAPGSGGAGAAPPSCPASEPLKERRGRASPCRAGPCRGGGGEEAASWSRPAALAPGRGAELGPAPRLRRAPAMGGPAALLLLLLLRTAPRQVRGWGAAPGRLRYGPAGGGAPGGCGEPAGSRDPAGARSNAGLCRPPGVPGGAGGSRGVGGHGRAALLGSRAAGRGLRCLPLPGASPCPRRARCPPQPRSAKPGAGAARGAHRGVAVPCSAPRGPSPGAPGPSPPALGAASCGQRPWPGALRAGSAPGLLLGVRAGNSPRAPAAGQDCCWWPALGAEFGSPQEEGEGSSSRGGQRGWGWAAVPLVGCPATKTSRGG